MARRIRLAVTADLHWGPRPTGDAATVQLIDFLRRDPPDVLVVAGDVGAGAKFGNCLAQFDELNCVKALVPGNHDIWVTPDDERGNSLQVYQELLPQLCEQHGFTYLDQQPLLLPEADLAVVGSINWYDYSWSIAELPQLGSDWETRLQRKEFTRGRHNDARFIRWPLTDAEFTSKVATVLERHLDDVLSKVSQAVVITHHPAFRGLNWPRADPPTDDGLLWEAFSGNTRLETVLSSYADRIPLVFCGHTHHAREGSLHGIKGYNVGGDYHFKRLLLAEVPIGSVMSHTFGKPDATD